MCNFDQIYWTCNQTSILFLHLKTQQLYNLDYRLYNIENNNKTQNNNMCNNIIDVKD